MASPAFEHQDPATRNSTSQADLHPLNNTTSASSSHSSVPQEIFSEGSRSRSNTPSSQVSTGDEANVPQEHKSTVQAVNSVEQGQSSLDTPEIQRHVQSNSISSTVTSTCQPERGQAVNSGHRASQGQSPILEAIELDELSIASHTLNNSDERHDNLQQSHDTGQDNNILRRPSIDSPAESIRAPLRPVRTSSILSIPLSWQPRVWPSRSARLIRRYVTARLVYGASMLVVALFAAASAAYFAWRTYLMTLWQTEKEDFDWCLQSMAEHPSARCEKLLKTELPPPPFQYSQPIERHSILGRTILRPTERAPVNFWTLQSISVIFMIALCMLIVHVGLVIVLQVLWEDNPKYERLSQVDSDTRWRARQRRSQDISYVRAEPRDRGTEDVTGPNTNITNPKDRSKVIQHKRVVPILEGLHEEDEDKANREDYNQSLHDLPTWKQNDNLRGLKYDSASSIEKPLPDNDDESEFDRTTSLTSSIDHHHNKPPNTSGLFLPKIPSTFAQTIRSKLRLKRSHLPGSFSSQTDLDDPETDLTPLGADLDITDTQTTPLPNSTNRIISGEIASGLLRAGATLAATSSGKIGKRLLVQLVEHQSDRIHNMIHTGNAEIVTKADEDYAKETEEFVQGTGTEDEARRWESQVRQRTGWSVGDDIPHDEIEKVRKKAELRADTA